MRTTLSKCGVAGPLVIVMVLLAASAQAQAPSKKPLLSDVIRATLEKEGAAAAQQRYEQIVREGREDYEFDYAALVEHAGAYMKAGEIAKGQALLEIAADAAARLVGPAPTLPKTERPARPRPTRETEEQAARRRTLEALGPGRRDLGRFLGVYGDPAAQDPSPRNFSIAETCDGHLRIGALWGDGSPWTLKSVSDTSFASAWEDPTLPHPIRVTFHTDASKRAQAMSHNVLSPDDRLTRLERLGDLPKEYVVHCTQSR